MLCSEYHISIRKTLSDILMPILYHTTVMKVKAKLDVAAGVCLIAVGWTSVNNNSSLVLTAHCLSEETNNVFQKHSHTNTFCGVRKFARRTVGY
jgi:hypothetical protein